MRPEKTEKSADKPAPMVGRKRDHARDEAILNAAIDVLAEVGFDSMTMDMVAARAKAGKATMYRRWDSKAELVRDALIRMNRNSLELDKLPDTGTLRGDLLALLKPQSQEARERKFRVLSGLGSFFSQHPDFAEAGKAGVFEPWTAANRTLMKRAVDRGEFPPHADIEMACLVLVAMVSFRGLIQNKPLGKPFFAKLIDSVLLPVLKNAQPSLSKISDQT